MPETTYLFPPPSPVSLPIEGSAARFPVHHVYCVGRNYAAHAREMGHDPDRDPPFFFQKNPDDIVQPGDPVPYPPLTEDLHHEIELVVALSSGGSDIEPAKALDHVFGYAVGLDLTRRDVQAEAKRLARPWATAKAFAASAPIGPIIATSRIGHPTSGRIFVTVDGEVRQDGDLSDMIWGVADIIVHLSRWFVLAPGDLIFTGTPAGVGGLKRGNIIDARIDGIGELQATIV